MASVAKSQTVTDFVCSVTRSELEKFNGAELYKLIEFAVVHELKLATPDSTASQVREWVIEWCCAMWRILIATYRSWIRIARQAVTDC
jgi:hypothetical protein